MGKKAWDTSASKRGRRNRRKGKDTELEAAKLLGVRRRGRIGIHAEDLANKDGLPLPICVEVKVKEAGWSVYAPLEQAARYARARFPMAMVRGPRKEWLIVLYAKDAKRLFLDKLIQDGTIDVGGEEVGGRHSTDPAPGLPTDPGDPPIGPSASPTTTKGQA